MVRVENGVTIEKMSILVQPPNNIYWNNFIEIHGKTPQHTANAPTFDAVWAQLEPYISNQNVVAHNGLAFDFQCIKQTLTYYNLALPAYTSYCTYKNI
jgi:DNA polymerase-3 subunit epsilon